MNTYYMLHGIHVACASLTFLGFLLRGVWMLQESPLLQKKPVRILPHVIDTLLLLSAIGLVIQTGQYPFAVTWVTLKLVLLVVYIVLGLFALRLGKTKAIRATSFGLGVVAILAIFALAIAKPV